MFVDFVTQQHVKLCEIIFTTLIVSVNALIMFTIDQDVNIMNQHLLNAIINARKVISSVPSNTEGNHKSLFSSSSKMKMRSSNSELFGLLQSKPHL